MDMLLNATYFSRDTEMLGPHKRDLSLCQGCWCNVTLQWADSVQQDTGSKRRAMRKKGSRSEEEAKGSWWSGAWFYWGALNRSVQRKGRQFQFVKRSGNNPDSIMDGRINIDWPTQKLYSNKTQFVNANSMSVSAITQREPTWESF